MLPHLTTPVGYLMRFPPDQRFEMDIETLALAVQTRNTTDYA
jgi:hypothetical protein